MSENDIEVGIHAVATESGLNSVTSALSDIAEAMQNVSKVAKQAATAAETAEKSVAGVGKASKTAAEGFSAAAKAATGNAKASQEATQYARDHAAALEAEYRLTSKGATEYAQDTAARIKNAAAAEEQAAALKKVVDSSSVKSGSANAVSITSKPTVAATPISLGASSVKDVSEEYKSLATNAEQAAIAEEAAAKAMSFSGSAFTQTEKGTKDLLSQQIAFQIAGDQAERLGKDILGIGAAAFSVAASYQKDFADVQRTTQTSGKQAQQLKADLISLSEQIPHTFENISEVAALGGQLGIATSGIVQFTEVTAKLKLTSDLTYDAAGTALGRVSTLLHVPTSQLENLASSILKVGVNSVSTESQIVKTVNNLAAVGSIAKLTGPEVVGLSGALASLGIPPELARGTFTQFFSKIGDAATNGGDALTSFAKVSGVSEQQFSDQWNKGGSSAVALLVKYFQGLGKEGANARNSLADVGIISVRYVPTLIKLAQNTGVLTKALKDANTGYVENTTLASQYATRTNTVSARLQILNNTFHAFLNNIGTNSLAPLAGVLDFAQKIALAFAKFASTPVGGSILTIITGIGALAGAALLGGGSLLKFIGLIKSFQVALGLGEAAAAGAAGATTILNGVLLDTVAADAAGAAGVAALAAGYDDLTVSELAAAAAADVYSANSKGSIGTALAQKFEGLKATAASAGTAITGFVTSVAGVTTILAGAALAAGILNNHFNEIRIQSDAAAAGVGRLSAATQKNKQLSSNQIVQSFANDQKAISKNGGKTQNSTIAAAGYQVANPTGENAVIATKDLGSLDKQLASLVKNGNLEGAHTAFEALNNDYGVSAKSLPLYTGAIKAYQSALAVANGTQAATTLTTQLSVKAFNALEKTIQEAAKGTAGYTNSLNAGLEANVSFQQSIADTQAAFEKSGKAALDSSGNLDITKQSGRDATTALLGLANAGNQVTANLESQGEPLSKVNSSYIATRQAVTKLGAEYGLTGQALLNFVDQAVAPVQPDYQSLLNQLGDTSDEANKATGSLKSMQAAAPNIYAKINISDAQKKIDTMKQDLKSVPPNVRSQMIAEIQQAEEDLNNYKMSIGAIPQSKTFRAYADTSAAQTAVAQLQAAIDRAGGSAANAAQINKNAQLTKAAGGLVTGPGTGTSDSINARLSNGEFVVTAKAVQRLGVPFLNSLNSNANVRNNPQMVHSNITRSIASSSSNAVQVVAFDPSSRALLMGLQTTVKIGNQVIAGAANAANLDTARRGANG